MAYFSGTDYCPKCNKSINWQCDINDGRRDNNVYSKLENQNTYEPKILSTPKAKVHVLCFVCEECGEIFIVKKSRSTHNPYKLR